ncbi:hypothetical protein ZIOFF_020390 [Zingiber officinale]|uniref:Uncharacterized protein n=1 Tax=Zingiber officinale TaxID=94328 RepID=A0A8J5H297_ZINOF|nr:hypothetical protein ZIOFF_020390 [Zingiber officinale]
MYKMMICKSSVCFGACEISLHSYLAHYKMFERGYSSILQLSWNWFLSEQCRFCTGSGKITIALGGENEVSQCINCDGAGTLTCTTCQGTGIQPRYLDRR